VEYELNGYLLQPEERLDTLGALHASIQDTFKEAGIAIVSPHYVHLTPEEGKGHAEEKAGRKAEGMASSPKPGD
jgi:small-conductance mechanosensitive channel